MKLYTVHYFCCVDWEEKHLEIIASSSDEVRGLVNMITPKKCRMVTKCDSDNEESDSLVIIGGKDVKFPYLAWSRT